MGSEFPMGLAEAFVAMMSQFNVFLHWGWKWGEVLEKGMHGRLHLLR